MKLMREAVNISGDLINAGLEPFNGGRKLLTPAAQGIGKAAQLDAQKGEALADVVVQYAADPPPFILLCLDQSAHDAVQLEFRLLHGRDIGVHGKDALGVSGGIVNGLALAVDPSHTIACVNQAEFESKGFAGLQGSHHFGLKGPAILGVNAIEELGIGGAEVAGLLGCRQPVIAGPGDVTAFGIEFPNARPRGLDGETYTLAIACKVLSKLANIRDVHGDREEASGRIR